MERIAVAIVLMLSGIFVPTCLFFPVYLVACTTVMISYRLNLWKLILKFLALWFLFYLAVGTGRFISGENLFVLFKDCSFGLGIAIAISSSLLLIVTDSPHRILFSLDRLNIPRAACYTILSLIRLLPRLKKVGKRQLDLLNLKTNLNGTFLDRFLAYQRIVGPLFGILLTQQYTHARSLNQRMFFDKSSLNAVEFEFKRSMMVVIILILNDFLWFGVWKWQFKMIRLY